MSTKSRGVQHRWRDYRTAAGRRPVKEFLDGLSLDDRAEVVAAMADVRAEGLRVARHVRRDIYEVRADGPHASVRILFAQEGRKGRILLALDAFEKKTQKTPERLILQRVLQELEDCKLIVLSGGKARLFAKDLRKSGRTVVEVPHVGNKGLNMSFKLSAGQASPAARRARRVQLWATKVVEAIPAKAAVS